MKKNIQPAIFTSHEIGLIDCRSCKVQPVKLVCENPLDLKQSMDSTLHFSIKVIY